MAVEMNPARGLMRVAGYELRAGEDVASPATEPLEFVA
jgi:hypothetical protein